MDSVILIADQAFTIQELFVKLRRQWPKTYTNSLGSVVIEDGENHLFVSVEPHGLEEYDPEQLDNIRKLMPSPRFFTIDYTDCEFVKRVLLAIADDSRLVVDNDAWTVLPGPAFVRRLREEPLWDWFDEFRRNKDKENESG